MITSKVPLIALISLLVVLVAGVLRLGFGTPAAIAWLPVQPATQRAATETAPTLEQPALSSFDTAWQTPLFSPDREPDPDTQKVEVNGLSGLTLVGIFSGGGSHIALLHQQNGQTLRLHIGQRLQSGWTLSSIAANSASFGANGETRVITLHRLTLPVDGDEDKPRVPKTGIVINEAAPRIPGVNENR